MSTTRLAPTVAWDHDPQRFVHAARDLPFHLADGSLGPSPFFP